MTKTAIEILNPEEVTHEVISRINGPEIEEQLIGLAQIGGLPVETPDYRPSVFATNRLALGENDERARAEIIRPAMEEAGLETEIHPLADIGILRGSDPELDPIVIISHTDTVEGGDMYDGVVGVFGGIDALRLMKESGFTPKRDVMVVSATGEESARFNMALFASRALFHGLTDKELSVTDSEGKSLEQVLGPENSELCKQPLFGDNAKYRKPAAAIELHVEQAERLATEGADIGVVNSIAAPIRHMVEVSNVEQGENRTTTETEGHGVNLVVEGIENHSGATPMGKESRADGLVLTSTVMESILSDEDISGMFYVEGIDVKDGSINKIPGLTATKIVIKPEYKDFVIKKIKNIVETSNSQVGEDELYPDNPITLQEQPEGQTTIKQPDTEVHLEALKLVAKVQEIGEKYSKAEIVATVGRYIVEESGTITLALDVRGSDASLRDSALQEIKAYAKDQDGKVSIEPGEALAGSGDPVQLDANLVEQAKSVIDRYEIGRWLEMVSKAGHDIQNVARADIASLLLFTRSHSGAHSPNSYATSAEIEQGIKALAAIVISLASSSKS